MDQLSPQDAQFLYMESENNLTHVTSISTFDPSTVPGGKTVRFKDIIAHIEARLDCAPMLKRKLVRVPLELDYPYWVDDEYFDLEYHMRHGRLPEPGDWRQFCIHMARYHSRPLDMNKPLWELYVCEGLDNVEGLPRGSYAIAIKLHHAAVDGASMMRFFSAIMDADNKGTPALPLATVEPIVNPRPSLRDMARRAAGNNLRSPVRIADAVMRATPGLYQAAQKVLRREDSDKSSVPSTRFNGDVSPHKVFDAVDFPLDDLKSVRPLVPGCTINDVVLAICSGALRRYLQKHKALPDDSLVAWVPINARPGGASDTDAPGNNISAMTTPIFTDIKDPVERLRRIRQSTQRSKEAKAGMSARLMTDISRHVPAATQVLASRLVLRSGLAAGVCNLFVSNVPGPQEQLYMNGARQVGSYGMAPLGQGMGLFIATPSYNGKMSFNVISTREIMPDVAFFVECLGQALQELKLAAKSGAGKKKPAPKRKTRARKKTNK
ncbi:MAG: wax ester/triacylglycerol synthase family O-acyltransferase [Halieaceae bacterium]